MNFFERMFSGDDSASYGRWASFLALVCLLMWTSILSARTGTIPDVPANWLMIVCIPFGISKVGEVIKSVKGGADAVPEG